MKGCFSLICVICLLFALFSLFDNFGFFNKNPQEVSEEIAQELSEGVAKAKNEEEILLMFALKSSECQRDFENFFDDAKYHLESSNYTTEEHFANDINKIQVIKGKLTPTIEKFREVELSNEEERQYISECLEMEMKLTDSLLESVQSKIDGKDWQEPLAKTQMLRSNLTLLQLPKNFEALNRRGDLYDKVNSFRNFGFYVKRDVEEIIELENNQLNSEVTRSYDLQNLQALNSRIKIILGKTQETDFRYESVQQKLIEAFELEGKMIDNLMALIDAKSYGEDWQPYLVETQALLKNYEVADNAINEMKAAIKSGKNPEEQNEEKQNEVSQTPQENTSGEEPLKDENRLNLGEFSDKEREDIKNYLERVQPFVVIAYGKDHWGINTPLASNDPQKLENYACSIVYAENFYEGEETFAVKKAKEICRNYFASEALIAMYYVALNEKSSSDGLLDNLANVAKKAGLISHAGDIKKLYELQDESEKEIRRLANWSGADLYDSVTEATIKITKNIFEEEFLR